MASRRTPTPSALSPDVAPWNTANPARNASPSLASELTLARRRGLSARGMRLDPPQSATVSQQPASDDYHLNDEVHPQPTEPVDELLCTNRPKHHGVVSMAFVMPSTVPSSATSQISSILSAKFHAGIDWRLRLRHFTWSFFSVTMATGGIASTLHLVPFRFPGLDIIGIVFFIFNLFLFTLFSILITLRFIKFPETLKASVTHPSESLFMPCFVASAGTLLLNLSQYGVGHAGYWLNSTIGVLFWIDVGLALLSSAGTYVLIWSTQTFTIAQMTPIWIAPAYALLSVGPIAGNLGQKLERSDALEIVIAGFMCQGIGFLVGLSIYSAFIYRLMTQKLPQEALRPAMFVSIGPAGFTAAAIINLAAAANACIPDDFMGDGDLVGTILSVVANFAALWLWGLAIWFFLVSVFSHLSCVKHGGIEFALSWWSFVFPNTALTSATFAIGKAFGSSAIQWTGCVMTAFLVAMWLFVFTMMVRAIIQKHLLWPQKQDDRDEGGFVAPKPKPGITGEKKNPV